MSVQWIQKLTWTWGMWAMIMFFYHDLFCLILDKTEWLLFNAKGAIFQLYHGENKLLFKEMMMRSVLY